MLKTYDLLTLPEVIALTHMSRSLIYLYVKEGRFPAPKKIGRRKVLWERNKVEAFVENAGKKEMSTQKFEMENGSSLEVIIGPHGDKLNSANLLKFELMPEVICGANGMVLFSQLPAEDRETIRNILRRWANE